ncbi:MAG TPA: PLP-dependent cysteine synthase family protein [Acidisarcina sp.]|nr:PLP-dependent cysteine synthase family protein [Acidisarcina sp.]
MNKTLGTSLLERIGNTPLLPLDKLTAHLPGVQILGKAEWANPGGSAKDRSTAAIVADARQRGLLQAGLLRTGLTQAGLTQAVLTRDDGLPDSRRLLDASSGNAGVSYAMLGAALGFPVTLCMPESISPEQKRSVAAYGAEAIYTPSELGLDGAILKARELAGDDPQRFCYVDQFSNDMNWQAHYQSTGSEIWEQTGGQVTHFVAGLGTSGTFLGTTRKLKQYNSRLECIAVQPDSPSHEIAGLKHISTTLLPAIYSPYLADRTVAVSTGEAREMTRRLAREMGLLVGISGGAVVAASLRIAEEAFRDAERAGKELVIVALLCDGGDRYLSSL